MIEESVSVGRDAVPSAGSAASRRYTARLRYLGIQAAAIITFLLLWYALSLWTRAGVLPGPDKALPRLADLLASGRFIDSLLATLTRTIVGFIGGFTLAVAYGIAAGRSAAFAHSTSLVFLVALFANGFIVILWGLAIFGNTSNAAAVIICSILVFPTLAVYIRDVVMSVDDDLLEMARAYRADRRQRALDVYLPFLVPALLACARIGFSLTWKIVLLTEVFGLPNGIGWQIQQSYSSYQIASLMAWLGVFIITLLAIEQLIRALERRVVKWR